MQNINVRQGSQLPLTVERADEEAISATIILKHQVSGAEVTETELFDDDGISPIVFDGLKTGVIGVYDMQVNENFTSESPNKYPDPDDCDEDCAFPTVTICESLDPEVS